LIFSHLNFVYSTLPRAATFYLIYIIITQYKDTSCQSDLKCDLSNFQTLCSDNLLDYNGSKCKVITFCRVNTQCATYPLSEVSLNRITVVNGLGVLLGTRLKFADHISSMVNKARGTIGFINHCWYNYDLHEHFEILRFDSYRLYPIILISDSLPLLKRLIVNFIA